MKKGSLVVLMFLLSVSVLAFAQHGHGGDMGNMGGMGAGASMGNGAGMGHDSSMGRNAGNMGAGKSGGMNGASATQQPLKTSQINGGAFSMLQRDYPSLSSQQLQDLYKSSGARNFGQFVSAMVVSKNLGLDYNKVLAGLKTESLGKTLQSLGVSKDNAKSEIKKAHDQIRDAERSTAS